MGDFLLIEVNRMAIVFLDLDGTLLDKGKPAYRAIEAVQKCIQNGHYVVVATGRIPLLLKDIIQEFGIHSYIGANGSYVFHEGKVLFEEYYKQDTLQRLIQMVDELEADLAFEGVDEYVAYRKNTDKVDLFSEMYHIKKPVEDKTFHLQNPILASVLFEDDVKEKIAPFFPELSFQRTSKFGYDVNLKGDLKANGIRVILENIPHVKEEVYAIGDGLNDINMLKEVHVGIAMGNASPEVKKHADYVTSSVDEGGVYDALSAFKLI